MDDMQGNWMDDGTCDRDDRLHRDPRLMCDQIIRTEEMEIPHYRELARMAPNECLRKAIEHMADEECAHVEHMRKVILTHFRSCGSCDPGCRPPQRPPCRSWLEGVKMARDTELRQCARLCHLAMMTPDPVASMRIIHLAMEELHEAMFWNNILVAFCGRMPGHHDPCGGMSDFYAEEDKKKK